MTFCLRNSRCLSNNKVGKREERRRMSNDQSIKLRKIAAVIIPFLDKCTGIYDNVTLNNIHKLHLEDNESLFQTELEFPKVLREAWHKYSIQP